LILIFALRITVIGNRHEFHTPKRSFPLFQGLGYRHH
jgi:hypothetical protein